MGVRNRERLFPPGRFQDLETARLEDSSREPSHPVFVLHQQHGSIGSDRPGRCRRDCRLLRLDGSDAAGEREAAELLGIKGSTFPAKKALGQARRLGHESVVRSIDLLAQADLDLRGGKLWPAPLVLEVLVARLASLAKK
jgi:hypothetical protein